ncbi:hypothetical protein O7622_04805 [Micromonospora sp. WMMD1076]|uniref:hypothetical protein n=1 Tax=Micromonospora sp. WMMD1076 TaxID=3016103 RepID=UPI00249C1087|nr:hypothetical protein [Micromonospora sp. WMMD1076]WFF07900.1 hypothetical protein O7622_04805 [Micromonospora sp. WMMD1076]
MWPRIGGLRALALGTPGELRTRLNTLVLSGVKTDRSIEEWREGHGAYWARQGTPVTEDTAVVRLRFRVVSTEGSVGT